MGFFSNLFKKQAYNHEAEFTVIITEIAVKVEHPRRKTEEVLWKDISEVRLINTDAGPAAPDVWLALIGNDSGCLIPMGAKGYDEVYAIVSKYEGFNFDNVI